MGEKLKVELEYVLISKGWGVKRQEALVGETNTRRVVKKEELGSRGGLGESERKER